MSGEGGLDKTDFQLSQQKNTLKNIENLKKEIKKLNYEESIDALEFILADLQDENISLDKIKTNYIKGHILLKHCEYLLECVEQEIIEINPENLN